MKSAKLTAALTARVPAKYAADLDAALALAESQLVDDTDDSVVTAVEVGYRYVSQQSLMRRIAAHTAKTKKNDGQ